MIQEGDKGYVIRPIKWAGAYVEVVKVVTGANERYYGERCVVVKSLKNYGSTRHRWRWEHQISEDETIRLRTDELWVTEPVDG